MKDVLQNFLSLPVFAWNKIYRRAFLERHHLRFIPGMYMEDNPFFFESFLRAERISALYSPLCCYRINRSDSIMSKNDERFFDHIKVLQRDEELLRQSEYWELLKEPFFCYKMNLLNLTYDRMIPKCKREFFQRIRACFLHVNRKMYGKNRLSKEGVYLTLFISNSYCLYAVVRKCVWMVRYLKKKAEMSQVPVVSLAWRVIVKLKQWNCDRKAKSLRSECIL